MKRGFTNFGSLNIERKKGSRPPDSEETASNDVRVSKRDQRNMKARRALDLMAEGKRIDPCVITEKIVKELELTPNEINSAEWLAQRMYGQSNFK